MDRLNLYLELEPGQLADLEVVARASISFVEAVREIAYIVDPSVTIRLELESGTEGSLSLNSVIKYIKKQVSDPVACKIIIITIIFWFAKEIGSAVIGVGVSSVLAPEPQLSAEQENRIAEKVVELLESRIGQKPVQEVYRELEKDKNIKGVGVSTQKGQRPKSIVPRDQFIERMGILPDRAETKEPRSRNENMLLTLISPVLQANKNKWRFISKYGTIYVGIKDKDFLTSVLSGAANISMQSGIIIFADVENIEKWDDDKKVWVVSERNIIKVHRVSTELDSDYLFPD